MADDKIKFKPVEIESDAGQWKPLPEGFQAIGPEAEGNLGGEGPTVLTGQSVPNEKDITANVVRYGVPAALSLAAPEAIIPGAIASGLSEITARQIEAASTDPTLDTLYKDLQAGGLAAGADIGMSLATKGMAKSIRWALKKTLIPKTIPPQVEIAQSILGKLDPESRRRAYQFFSSEHPFSVSVSQLNPEEKAWVAKIDNVLRSSFFGEGPLKKNDVRNIKAVSKALSDFVEERTSDMTGPEFGTFMRRLIGTDTAPGELFKPVEAYRAYLYDIFTHQLEQSGEFVDLSNVQKLLSNKNPNFRTIFESLKSPGPEGVGYAPSHLKSKAWSRIPASDVDQLLKRIQVFYNDTNKTLARDANTVKEAIASQFNKTVKKIPGAAEAREAATSLFMREQDTLNNALINKMRKVIGRHPSGIVSLFDPTKGNAANKYDELKTLKKAIFFASEAPDVAGRPVARTILSTQAEKVYEKAVLDPLRFRFVFNTNTIDDEGRFVAGALMKQFEKIEKAAPEMLEEIWGGPAQVKAIKEFATALKISGSAKKGTNVYIKLAQASAAGAVGSAAFAFDDPKLQASSLVSGIALFLAPNALARVFANPTLTRQLTEGLKSGANSTGLALALRRIATMKVVTEVMKDASSEDALSFYTYLPPEAPAQPQPPAIPPNPQLGAL